MSHHENCGRRQLWLQQMADRPIVASAATGSLSSLLLWLLKESYSFQPPLPPLSSASALERLDCECPSFETPKLDFWAGLIIGLILWPVIEFAVLVKQWLTLWLRNKIANLGSSGGKLYRVLA